FGKNWFVLYGQEGSGSGYYLYGETWFAVTGTGVKPVLNYSVNGQMDPGLGGLKWEFNAQPVPLKSSTSPRIRLVFTVHYLARGFGESHFTKRFTVTRHADYVGDSMLGSFHFDPRSSSISQDEMNAVANTGSDPSEADNGTRIGQTNFFSSL